MNPKSLTSCLIIPARLASTRLPRKLLLPVTDKPLIQHTYEAAQTARLPREVIVAADHQEIADAVRDFGGRVEMTDPNAASGTDRVAEVARKLPDVDVIVNVQGDEPELSGEAIDTVVTLLVEDPGAVMATLASPIRDRQQLEDPSCVKVVFDNAGRAMYFSRSVIPHPRKWDDSLLAAAPPVFFQHIGLYAYRRNFLLDLHAAPRSAVENLESLEQLRVLSMGHSIQIGVVEHHATGIDTPEDYKALLQRMGRAA